jgi:hypothetical protein
MTNLILNIKLVKHFYLLLAGQMSDSDRGGQRRGDFNTAARGGVNDQELVRQD